MIIRLGVDYKSAVYKTSQQCYGFIICNLVLYYSSLLDSNLCNFFSDWLGKCECISYFSKL